MENDNKYIDLTYLKQLSNGSEEFIDKMIGIFIEQTPEALSSLDSNLEAKNWPALRATAHKMKSSISIMGIKALEGVVGELEDSSSKEINLDKIPQLVEEVKRVSLAAIDELKVLK